ncbi:class A beta-lactamase-related serine hydrolase [Nocardia yunnanensis]|uniref:Class A beta-lactamase-related serine hydrolase n=1 Tax=Nocardia yunnanensis TaxID=2382165 RepID=A0A386ZQZ3_9NOCA|nr:serine hydrolase domain-containing protein [Nocardia yunnanensis]AYF79624.1 class A beta-lactamase-related serine hydrolase [Nocardia yunnanensis]
MNDITIENDSALTEFVAATAAEHDMPGMAVGIWADGRVIFANTGVTSTENPVPVTEHTLFAIGSTSKTFTTTALLRLVADGRVDLDAPVRTYVPELTLLDERHAAAITVRQLLNHTAGLEWNIINNTGEGDDGLAAFVASLAELPLIAAPGERPSYSQAGFNLLGRVIENVTGVPFEQVVAETVLAPVGLRESFYSRDEVMTRRFAAGHERQADGQLAVARAWKGTRANNPGGGLGSTVSDLLRWGRFHLGDGHGEHGDTVLPAELLDRMKQPTARLRASAMADAFGLCWMLRDVDGVRVVGHDGSGFGQFANFQLVPERNFAVVVLSNASPDGIPANQAVVRWALRHYLGVVDADPEPVAFDAGRAPELFGVYDIDAMTMTCYAEGEQLLLECKVKPEIRAAAPEAEIPQDHPPFPFGLLPGDGDEYVITAGSFQGQRGFFSRDERGEITGIDLAGRLFTRIA